MLTLKLMGLAAVLVLAFFHTDSQAQTDRPAPAKPTSHTTRQLEGWTVHVDDRLLSDPNRELGDRAVRLLSNQLYYIALVVPADKVVRLRQVPIWLDLTHGSLRNPQYHPSRAWLKEHGFDAALAKCVHIPDAAYFCEARFQYEQPCAVLHELAHSYHDQVLGFEDPQILEAWHKFVESGKYKSVLSISGQMRRHYALTDQKEFFAEMTESFFGHNDFYPFNAVELRRDEPELFALLEKIWGGRPATKISHTPLQ
jgi:hypothetical protein